MGDPDPGGTTIDPESDSERDIRSHADRAIRFDVESPRILSRSRLNDPRALSGDPAAVPATGPGLPAPADRFTEPPSQPELESPRVEVVPHVVERDENFWTISRLYYSSGRYYRALWKANAGKVREIDRLHVGDVILIPPVEELDPADIDAPRARPAAAAAALDSGGPDSGGRRPALNVTEPAEPPSSAPPRQESLATTRTNRKSVLASTHGIPSRRSRRTDTWLDLPVSDPGSGRDRDSQRAGAAPVDRADVAGTDGPEIRVAARPRSSAPPNLPVYKVRRYDTLRSIARDTLGDARRADEILELNRDLIDDPRHLITGQLLDLPEDADTRRITTRGR